MENELLKYTDIQVAGSRRVNTAREQWLDRMNGFEYNKGADMNSCWTWALSYIIMHKMMELNRHTYLMNSLTSPCLYEKLGRLTSGGCLTFNEEHWFIPTQLWSLLLHSANKKHYITQCLKSEICTQINIFMIMVWNEMRYKRFQSPGFIEILHFVSIYAF